MNESTATLAIAADRTYESGRLLSVLGDILTTHRAVGDEFPDARQPLVDNLRALQCALPAAIAEVEAAR